MRAVFSELPEACDATLDIAERVELDLVYGDRAPIDQRYHLPRFETPGGIAHESYLRQLVDEGARARYGPDLPQEVRDRIEHELSVIISMGFAGLLPDRVGPDPLRARAGHPCRSRARQRRRLRRLVLAAHHRPGSAALRPAVRAIPEPRADPDAGHRHGLRRAPPRRGDPVRHRAVRRRPRRADHHVPDDQGQAGDPRRRARAGVPARDGGPSLQDVPAAGHGARLQDRDRARSSRPSCATPTRTSPRPRRSSTRPGRSRACAARTPCTPPAS